MQSFIVLTSLVSELAGGQNDLLVLNVTKKHLSPLRVNFISCTDSVKIPMTKLQAVVKLTRIGVDITSQHKFNFDENQAEQLEKLKQHYIVEEKNLKKQMRLFDELVPF